MNEDSGLGFLWIAFAIVEFLIFLAVKFIAHTYDIVIE